MFTPAIQALYFGWSIVVFASIARWTKPPPRRLLGVVLAVVAFTACSAPIDEFGARHALWTYPCCPVPPFHPPLVVYLGQATIFVGALALVAWRVSRAFGGRGLALLVAIALLLGLARDFTVAHLCPSMLRFGRGALASILADLTAWSVVVAVALVVPRVVAGRADA